MASSMEGSQQQADPNNPQNNGSSGTTERRRKRRWGAASGGATTPATATTTTTTTMATTTTTTTTAASGPVDSKAKALALKASIAARLAALKSKSKPAAAAAGIKRPLPPPPPPTAASLSATTASASATTTTAPVAKRAKHYELDMSVTGPTFQKASASLTIAKPKPKVNPYLAHRQEPEADTDDKASSAEADATANATANEALVSKTSDRPSEDSYVDARLEAAGHETTATGRRRRRELRFVEPGTFVDIAERKRQRAANAESAGFASGRKAGQYFRSATLGGADSTTSSTGNYYGTTAVVDDLDDKGVLAPRAEVGGVALDSKAKGGSGSQLRAMPLVVEWWDMELLPSKLKKQVSAFEGTALSKATQSQMQQFSTPSAAAAPAKEGGDAAKDGETEASASASPVTDKAEELRTRCSELVALSHSKTASLVQHIVPIPPPGDAGKKAAEPVLHLTKKERKRARKRRREQKQRELQDLQAAGLVEPPEPRLTLQNFIRVMGDQAYVDPSQMERKVMEQVQKRQRAHLERNAAKKLTKEQKAEKRRTKISRDAAPASNATGAIHVALFYVKNASHPYHRTKLDLNAQQLSITGGVLECDFPTVSCVICEGGPRAIQKYKRLMLVRMKWKGPDDADDDDDDDDESVQDAGADGDEPPKQKHRFDRDNVCELVWTGLATKRQFKGFVFQHCETSAQARKVLTSRGVGQYWDQVLAHASGSGDSLHLKLVDSDDSDGDDSGNDNDNENDNGPSAMDVDTDADAQGGN